MWKQTGPAATRAVADPSNLKRHTLAVLARSRVGSVVLLWVILLLEAGVGTFVIHELAASYGMSHDMYHGSVRGLRQIGELQYEAQETRRSTLYALSTNDGNLQVSYADQTREADRRVTQGVSDYLAQARTAQEAMAGRRLATDWSAYLKVRDDVLGRILEGTTKEAVDEDLRLGVPLFDRVRQDLDEIKRLYEQQASGQLLAVEELSRHSLTRLIPALVISLLFGSVAIWTIQRNQVRSAIHLAQLQMDFVASVSHELRTPITAILTIGENIQDGLVQGRDALQNQIANITAQAGQLKELVDQVLLFAATTKGRPWQPVPELQVPQIVERALRNTDDLLQKAGFVIERQIDPALPPVMGDLSVLSQCLQNLVSNAIKYSNGYRWVAVSAKMNEVSGEVQISVQDRGVGINGADLAHVFEPFYRSPQAVAARIQGVGLGLSIAKRSVEIFGGRLTVLTEVGAGSTFTMHLPISGRRSKVSRQSTKVGALP